MLLNRKSHKITKEKTDLCELRRAPRLYVTKCPEFASPECTTTANNRYKFLGNIEPNVYELYASLTDAPLILPRPPFIGKLADSNDTVEPHGVLAYFINKLFFWEIENNQY